MTEGTASATGDPSRAAMVRARRLARGRSGLASAVVGAGVVLGVHYGRAWADDTCRPSGDCLGADATIQRNLLLVVAIVAAAAITLIVARSHRAWLVLPLAFALQGSVMFVVEHTDGFWLPLWLDAIVGAATWGVVGAMLRR